MENQRNFGALLEGNIPMNGMPTKERVELLPVDLIDPHPLNPRIVTPESLDEAFLESVERNGVLQPVFVKLGEGGRYQMLAGHRRLCASKVAKHTHIRAIVKRKLLPGEESVFLMDTNIQDNFKDMLPSQKCRALCVQYDGLREMRCYAQLNDEEEGEIELGGKLIGEYTTDDQGQILFEENLLPEKIKIKEIRAEGYVVDPDDIRTVELESGKLIELVWENEPERGQIQIIKQSAEYNDITKLPEGSALEGAVFEIFDLNNEVLDTITTDARGVATSKPLPLQIVGIRELQAPEHYLLNGKVFWAEIKKHGDVVKFVVENANEEVGVDVKKVGNIEAMPGDTIRYDFSDIRNESNVPLDNFYWRDILPTDAVTLRSISTGTWNEELKYTIYYKTNLVSEERVLAERLSTGTNNTIDCSASALKLKAGEVITEIRFDFGTVQPGFEPVTNPYITCLVHPDLPHEYRFKNCTDVGGERGDEWVIDKDCWVTVIYAVPKGKLPKTGN